jgi:hypothetical protein
MLTLNETAQLAALRDVVFGTIDDWNSIHPHPLRSHHEHGSVNVTYAYTDSGGMPSYTIAVVCTLAGSASLVFHGHDLATVAEHARLTLEHRIGAELEHRAERAREAAFDHADGFDHRYAFAG